MKQTQLLNFKLLPRVIATTVDTAESVLLLVTICGSKQASKGPKLKQKTRLQERTLQQKNRQLGGWVGCPGYLSTDRQSNRRK
jgi:hypothetical protein